MYLRFAGSARECRDSRLSPFSWATAATIAELRMNVPQHRRIADHIDGSSAHFKNARHFGKRCAYIKHITGQHPLILFRQLRCQA